MKVVPYSSTLKQMSFQFRERSDCTVMAWSNCFDAEYSASHAWMKKHGRKDRKGMNNLHIRQALENVEKAKVKIGPYSRKNRITLKRFCEEHPVGRYYILVRGHALCVKDGVVYDHSEKPRRQVIFAARIYLEGEALNG